MRLWKKKSTAEKDGNRQGGIARGQQGGIPSGQQGGIPSGQQSGIPSGQQGGVGHGGDASLPGSAGYRGHRQAAETVPSRRFNFVRPDGKPKPEGGKG